MGVLRRAALRALARPPGQCRKCYLAGMTARESLRFCQDCQHSIPTVKPLGQKGIGALEAGGGRP